MWTTSPSKTRVGVSRRHASGRLSRRRRFRSMFTPASRACAYRTASGRAKWPNRDPLGEPGFEVLRGEESFIEGDGPNLYQFAVNDPVNEFDVLGLFVPPPAPPTVVVGPPPVVVGTVCVAIGATISACTPVGDWIADGLLACKPKSDLEECKDDCYDTYIDDNKFCDTLRTRRQREYCRRQAFKLYVNCLKDCQKQHGGK
jgi:hypothetical protein